MVLARGGGEAFACFYRVLHVTLFVEMPGADIYDLVRSSCNYELCKALPESRKEVCKQLCK